MIETGREKGKMMGYCILLKPYRVTDRLRRLAWHLCWAIVLAQLVGEAKAFAGQPVTTLSRHYRVHSDLPADFTAELSDRLDAMYEEYANRLSDFSEIDSSRRFDVHLFARRIDYMKFTDNRLPNTGGVFMSGRNCLAAFLEGQGRDGLRRTLQHEAFHQFAHGAISDDLPVWLNEGLSQIFEEGLWTGSRFWIGHVPPRRVRQLQFDISKKRLLDFKSFINLSHEDWAKTLARDPDRGAARYNQAWAMTHFLIYAGDESNQYRQRLLTMLKLLHRGSPAGAAFEEAFGTNYKGFQERFFAWAKQMAPTTEAAMIERHEILADMLIEFAKSGKTFATPDEFRAYAIKCKIVLTYRKGDITWQSDKNVANYFLDSAGNPYTPTTLRFSFRADATLPDLLARPSPQFLLKAQLIGNPSSADREVSLQELDTRSARTE